jgi:hypothetical protein
MKPKGIYVAVGGPHGHWFGAMFRMLMALFIAFVMSRFASLPRLGGLHHRYPAAA